MLKQNKSQISIPLTEPSINGREWEYVKECIETGWVSSVGEYVARFEREVATYCGAQYAVSTASGTAALHMALMVAGVEVGDEVLVSDLTFIATANAVRYLGAHPVFIDAEPTYWQMDIDKVATFLREECCHVNGEIRNKTSHRRIKAIVPVHILGHPVDIDPLLELAHEFGLTVVEDAAEGMGSLYKGSSVGNLAHVGCFSFNGNKIVTTGGGGMIVTNDRRMADRARYLSTQAKDDALEYVHGEVGYNYRMNNILAAVGCAQLEQLDHFVSAKRTIAEKYRQGLNGLAGIELPREAPWAFSTYWLYTILVDDEKCGITSRELIEHLASHGIQCRPIWQPMHASRVYNDCQATDCSIADLIYQQAVSLPCSVRLGDMQDVVTDAIRNLWLAQVDMSGT